MRIVFLGDIVGRPGRRAVLDALPSLRGRHGADVIVINGENAAGGFGITEAILTELIDAGIDAVTLGNHAFDQKEALVFIERHDRLVRPLNLPPGTPGRGASLIRARNGANVLVGNLLGRVYMGEIDCPFRAATAALDTCPLGKAADAIILDLHAEATSEKQAFGLHVDGRVTLVAGTHTHVPTADHRVLAGGTAYVSDVGMCGDYDSVLGMEAGEPLNRFLTRIPRAKFEPATGPATVSGVIVESDDRTGLARSIRPLRLGGVLEPAEPAAAAPT
jgi:hypothetical protein